eukprot:TRINITY_DN4509_c0_g1_i2.p4 TRINITY_DN4509_c0_g1~~TRINITY_DN4509_c0_g1_i2.p4  ORF type:complete len:131 (-),score=3.93 TRINITY_DN4509_c0_g1_i2:265-657(-)
MLVSILAVVFYYEYLFSMISLNKLLGIDYIWQVFAIASTLVVMLQLKFFTQNRVIDFFCYQFVMNGFIVYGCFVLWPPRQKVESQKEVKIALLILVRNFFVVLILTYSGKFLVHLNYRFQKFEKILFVDD